MSDGPETLWEPRRRIDTPERYDGMVPLRFAPLPRPVAPAGFSCLHPAGAAVAPAGLPGRSPPPPRPQQPRQQPGTRRGYPEPAPLACGSLHPACGARSPPPRYPDPSPVTRCP